MFLTLLPRMLRLYNVALVTQNMVIRIPETPHALRCAEVMPHITWGLSGSLDVHLI